MPGIGKLLERLDAFYILSKRDTEIIQGTVSTIKAMQDALHTAREALEPYAEEEGYPDDGLLEPESNDALIAIREIDAILMKGK